MTKKKHHIEPAWKKSFATVDAEDRKSLGINRSNYRVEFSKELRTVRKQRLLR